MGQHLNRIELIGNLGRDPEVTTTQDGNQVLTLSVATDEAWKNKAGERQTRTEWHRVVIYAQKLVEIASGNLKKGHLVRLVGKNRTRKWTKDGVDHYTTEIILGDFHAELTFLERKPAAESEAA